MFSLNVRNIAVLFSSYISNGAKKNAKWTSEEEEELQRVYEEYKDSGGETTFACVCQ